MSDKIVTIDYSKLQDTYGHDRFVDLTSQISVTTGFFNSTGRYLGATLCGSHLMIVAAGQINKQIVPSGTRIIRLTLPNWIKSSIYNIGGSSIITPFKFIVCDVNGENITEYNGQVWQDSEYIYVSLAGGVDFSDKQYVARVQIDLVIS